jgi:GT2 family glycosyltransferase
MISLVIVTWNCRRQIQDCLESLDRQDFREFETIVIDQASKDGTAEYLRYVQERFRLRLICRTTKGTWCYNNKWGVSLAKGEWIAISNPDIVFPDGTLSRLAKWAATMSETEILGCNLASPDGRDSTPFRRMTTGRIFHFAGQRATGRVLDKRLWRRFFERQFTMKIQKPGVYRVGHLNGSFFMVNRAVVNEIGLWDDKYRWAVADSDFFEIVNRSGFKQFYNYDIRLIHEGEYSRKLTPKPEYEYEYAYGYSLYARIRGLRYLRALFFIDAILSPLLVCLVRQDSLRNQIRCSAAKMMGLFA